MAQSPSFSDKDFVVYPAHGVGQLVSIETQSIAGQELKVFVISFEKNRMTLRLPMNKAREAGLRKLSSTDEIQHAFSTLKKHSRAKKGIWSRRAQEYELKINSGSLTSLAEVITELHRSEGNQEQSYSERQIYQEALERLASEVAVVEKLDRNKIVERVEETLGTGADAEAA